MIKRNHIKEPFSKTVIEKKAYSLDGVDPEDYRTEIKNYIQSLYPFLTAGLQVINFKSPPDEEGNAIGYMDYERDGVKLVIPAIVEDKHLKEPTIAIYNDSVIPIDKEYLEYIIDYRNSEQQVDNGALPSNMQYITQSGLFQDTDSGVYKTSEIVGTIFDEDPENPYHYKGSVLRKHANNSLSVEDGGYFTSTDMLKIMTEKTAEDPVESSPAAMANDKRVLEMPTVQKIKDTGAYKSVMIGGGVEPMDIYGGLFRIEGGDAKVLAIGRRGRDKYDSECCSTEVGASKSTPEVIWAYGDGYGSGFNGRAYYMMDAVKATNIQDVQLKHIIFSRPGVSVRNDYNESTKVYSTPYKVEMTEAINYGDGKKATVMHVKSEADKSRYTFIVTPAVADVSKVNTDKLKNSTFRYLYDDSKDIYLVPSSYEIYALEGRKTDFDDIKNGYRGIVDEIQEDYPNTMDIISKGAGLYTVNVSDGDTDTTHRDVSSNAALLYANYYTGQKYASIKDYKMNTSYAFKGDISIRQACRTGMEKAAAHKGDYSILAGIIKGYTDIYEKVAGVKETVDSLVGIDSAVDDESFDTTNMLHVLDNVISKIGELLLMSRLGRNDMSESILSRALAAITKLSNEIRGVSTANVL